MQEQSEQVQIEEMPYFVGLTSRELEAAARALSAVEVACGEVIFAQGDDGGWVYILVRGTAEISIQIPTSPTSLPQAASGAGAEAGETDEADESGGRRVVAALQAPALLGEMSVLLEEPRSAWAVATSRCLLWQVSRDEVRRALEANQKWAQRLLLAMSKILAERLAEMNRQLAALASQQSHALHNSELATLQQSLYKHE